MPDAETLDAFPLGDPAVPPPYIIDRREPLPVPDPVAQRARLTPPQRDTLAQLERSGWRLAFVRQTAARSPVPVVFDQEGLHFIVIRADGSIDEQPALQLRG